jgi:hypothetical protein
MSAVTRKPYSNQPFSPAEIKRACKIYMQHDVLPADKRLRQIVVDRLKIQEADAWDDLDHPAH